MINQGWISIHRQIMENPIFTKPNYFAIWIYILLNANHKDTKFILNNAEFTVKRGQYFGSIKKIADNFNLSKGTVHYILNYFEVERMIERNKNGNFTLATIINYDKYQEVERVVENKLNANKTLIETYNNENNENNREKQFDEDKLSLKDLLSLPVFYINKYKIKYPTLTEQDIKQESEKAYHWCKSNGKTKKNYNSFLINWLQKTVSYKELQKSRGYVNSTSTKTQAPFVEWKEPID